MTDNPEAGTIETPTTEAPDAELVEFLGGESQAQPTETKAPAQAAQPETPEGSQPRDATGRFAKADAPAATDEPAAEAETPDVAPPEPAPAKPFSYRAYGAEHNPFTGAVENPDGSLTFPGDAAKQLRQALAEGHNAESRRRTTEREHTGKIVSARNANALLVQRASETLGRLAELRKSPEALQQFFADLDRNWAILEAEVRAETLEQQLSRQQQEAEERAIEAQVEALRPHMRSTLEQRVGEMIHSDAAFGHLDPKTMSERLWNSFFDRVFVEAEEDGPGYRKGEILIDYDAMRAELAYEAGLRRTVTPPAPPVKQPEAKAPEKKAPVTPPPVVTAKGAGAKPAPKVPKFSSTKEADDWLESGGYNDL